MIFEYNENMMTELKFRRAAETDAALIRALADEVFPVTYRQILTAEQIAYMMELMYSPDSIHRQMAEGHVYEILYSGDVPVGYVSVEQQGTALFHLQKLYLLPQYQGRGWGRKLFGRAIEIIKAWQPEPCRVELNVNRYNPALAFYERMGMRRKCAGDFDIGSGYYMNDYIMDLTV